MDHHYMRQALDLARDAADAGEIPVGAIVVYKNKIIGRGYNKPIQACDPSQHAEIVAIREAAQTLNNYRLPGAILYSTLEPCLMCAGAIAHARLARCVFGAHDLRAGAIETKLQVFGEGFLNHIPEITSGVLAKEARALLQEFFRLRRA